MPKISRGLVPILLLVTGLSMAESSSANGKEDSEGAQKQPQQVHLEDFEVPLGDTGRMIAFTMFLFVNDQGKIWQVCRDEARVRDAVMTYLYAYPFRLTKDNDIDIKRVEKKLRPRINKALQVRLIEQVKIGKGKIPLQEGPLKNPNVPNPVDCGLIGFRQKGKQ